MQSYYTIQGLEFLYGHIRIHRGTEKNEEATIRGLRISDPNHETSHAPKTNSDMEAVIKGRKEKRGLKDPGCCWDHKGILRVPIWISTRSITLHCHITRPEEMV